MIGIVAFVSFVAPARFFYFVRHGETMANASGHYSARTLNAFSAQGKKEVSALTDELLKLPPFDLILVSPSPRALRTIAPYLERTGRKATIWPLLYECCTGRRPAGVQPKPFSFGAPVSIPADLKEEFILIKGETRLPNAPSYSEGLTQVQASLAEFDKKYMGRRVLLVGHSGQGGHFIHDLTGKWTKLNNAQLRKITLN